MHNTIPIVLKTRLSSLFILGLLLAAATPLQAQQRLASPLSLPPSADAGPAARTLPAPTATLLSDLFTEASAGGPYTPLALSCSINVACSEGSGHSSAIRATVRIVQGGDACTGVLLNNTEEDGTPYVLTARHCGYPAVGQTVNWTFQFAYQSDSCEDPAETPVPQSITGATVVAAQSGIGDFALLQLSQPVPEYYDAVFAGWSIKDNVPSSSFVVGHPRKDIKKITLEDDALTDASDSWVATFDHGTIESGSSGAPLFDDNNRVIGHVRSYISMDPDSCSGTGGDDNAATILFPKLSTIWDSGPAGQRISDFLDPQGTGAESLGPISASSVLPVELTSFDALVDGKDVLLRWETVSETNNAGFEIQRISKDDGASSFWQVLGFVDGHGTVEVPKSYAYRVEDLEPGRYTFRLKQIDYDGTFEYHPEVEALIEVPTTHFLSAAYPNPFNPQTQVRLSVARRQHVTAAVYDVTGRLVRVLFEGTMEADAARTFTFDASGHPSGLYLMRVAGQTFTETQTLTLLK